MRDLGWPCLSCPRLWPLAFAPAEQESAWEREERGSRLAWRSCCLLLPPVLSFSHSAVCSLFLLISKTPAQPSCLILSTDWKASRRLLYLLRTLSADHPPPIFLRNHELRPLAPQLLYCPHHPHPHPLTSEFSSLFQKSETARRCVHRTSAQPWWTWLSLCHPSRPVDGHLDDLESTLKSNKTHRIAIQPHH